MKYANVARQGDIIKSLDFNPLAVGMLSFITAEVLEIEASGYSVRVLKSDSGSTKHDILREGAILFVPFELTMGEFEDRVTLVITKDEYELICSEVPEAQ